MVGESSPVRDAVDGIPIGLHTPHMLSGWGGVNPVAWLGLGASTTMLFYLAMRTIRTIK